MKLRILATALLFTTISPTFPATAENLQHTRQLLSTGQCQECELTGAGLVLANLSGANLKGANLAGANLSRANLTGADLTGANLAGTSLFGANLTGANLTGANLAGTDLRSAYLSNAILLGVDLSNAILIGAIGLPTYTGSAEDFYRLGIAEAQAGNYRNAIDYYNRALAMKPDLAAAYFARSMAKGDLNNYVGALEDAEIARQLYASLGSPEGEKLSEQLGEVIEARRNPAQPKREGGIMAALGSLLPTLLRLAF